MPDKDFSLSDDDWVFSSKTYADATSEIGANAKVQEELYTNADDYWEDDEIKYNNKIYTVHKVHKLTNKLEIKPKWTNKITVQATALLHVKASDVTMHKLAPNTYYAYNNKISYKQCSHKMVEYKFPKTKDLSVYMSSSKAGKLESDLKPTHGVYLDSIWNDELFTFNDSAVSKNPIINTSDSDKQSKVFVDWPDQRAIDITDFHTLVEYCWRTISMGILEIGCIGGHGRTGTLLGGMVLYHSYLIKEPIDFKTAMETVRDKYCDQAIESKAQENLLEEYAMLLGDKHE